MWFHHCNEPGCCPGDRNPGAAAARKRGRLTIDLHCHALVPAAEALVAQAPQKLAEPAMALASMGAPAVAHNNSTMLAAAGPRLTRIEQRLADMDAMGVDVQVISPSPTQYYYWADADLAREVVRVQNEAIAALCRAHPTRLAGFGTVALQQFDVQKVARPVMAELGATTGYSVFLGVWGNKGPTIVYRVECAKNPPLMEMRVGSVLPLLNSALGRNFLSHLPEHMTSTLTKDELARQKTNPELILGADAPRSMDQGPVSS